MHDLLGILFFDAYVSPEPNIPTSLTNPFSELINYEGSLRVLQILYKLTSHLSR
jgi:hypothetical protein